MTTPTDPSTVVDDEEQAQDAVNDTFDSDDYEDEDESDANEERAPVEDSMLHPHQPEAGHSPPCGPPY